MELRGAPGEFAIEHVAYGGYDSGAGLVYLLGCREGILVVSWVWVEIGAGAGASAGRGAISSRRGKGGIVGMWM